MKDKLSFLSSNGIKFIAAFCMLCDHVGYIFFPKVIAFRFIGRIAFPLFAFMIAEGCRYTRNKLKHFLTVALFAFTCQLGLFIFDKDMGMSQINVFVTFTFSIIMIYALQAFYERLFSKDVKAYEKIFFGIIFIATIFAVYYISLYISFDYGFFGALIPLFASVFMLPGVCDIRWLKVLDNKYMHILTLGMGVSLMVFLSKKFVSIKWCALLSLVVLLFYSGRKGKLKTKYFFYVFYPLHLVLLEGLYMLMNM